MVLVLAEAAFALVEEGNMKPSVINFFNQPLTDVICHNNYAFQFANHPERFSLGEGEGEGLQQREIAVNHGEQYMYSTIQVHV